jgi:hypothetical protein
MSLTHLPTSITFFPSSTQTKTLPNCQIPVPMDGFEYFPLSSSQECYRPLHPSKATTIKAEINKLHAIGFIYPIAYTLWVSNPVPIDKKQGIIHVCTYFHDLNNACPKDNFPTPFIDQIIDDCVGHEALSFMDGFSGYNQIQIHPADQYKIAFTTPWGTFAYRAMPFSLKNASATFQRAMTYIFHDMAYG